MTSMDWGAILSERMRHETWDVGDFAGGGEDVAPVVPGADGGWVKAILFIIIYRWWRAE